MCVCWYKTERKKEDGSGPNIKVEKTSDIDSDLAFAAPFGIPV